MTRQTHAFAATGGGGAPLRVQRPAPVARFSLRVRASHRAALGRALGLELPERVGTVARAAGRAALCLGPDEWLIHAPEAEAEAIAAAGAGAAAPHALVEISDREVTLEIAGPGTRELLAMHCPRDLDRLPVGGAVRTLFDTVQVVAWRDGDEAVRLDVWRSFAGHVEALLEIGRAELAAGL